MKRLLFLTSAAGVITAALFLPTTLALMLLIGYIFLAFVLRAFGSEKDGY
jgi:hypothetical protein